MPPSPWSTDQLMRRSAIGSIVFFVLAPGVAAGLVPWLFTHWETGQMPPSVHVAPLRVLGVLVLVAGTSVVVYAFVQFVTEGRGTPAPVAPPSRLVVGGLYRWVRNPMYVAVGAVIGGQALLLRSWILTVYLAAFWAVAAAFVRGYEEPVLRAKFGADYEEYREAVPAWLPRLRPWRAD